MAEYIRKDHAINLARASDGEHRGKEWLVKQLEMIHPADVRPVMRGRWKKNDNGTYSCERCHSWIPEEQRHYANWCLYCGADMRGGDAE